MSFSCRTSVVLSKENIIVSLLTFFSRVLAVFQVVVFPVNSTVRKELHFLLAVKFYIVELVYCPQ